MQTLITLTESMIEHWKAQTASIGIG